MAVTANFVSKLKLKRAGRRTRTFVVRCAQVGHIARAAVFAIIGLFLIEAAIHGDPREARGLGSALYTLEQQRYGNWLLATVAIGFLAYPAYLLLLIVYRPSSTTERAAFKRRADAALTICVNTRAHRTCRIHWLIS